MTDLSALSKTIVSVLLNSCVVGSAKREYALAIYLGSFDGFCGSLKRWGCRLQCRVYAVSIAGNLFMKRAAACAYDGVLICAQASEGNFHHHRGHGITVDMDVLNGRRERSGPQT